MSAPTLASEVAPALATVLAIVLGEPITECPSDLFIPPDALRVLLDSFTGPLDLLCYLIRRQNIDIMNIPIAIITQQYLDYIALMEKHHLELAADYLVMAAMLAEIKSRLLLPRPVLAEDEPEEDPRMQLVRKLQAYEQIKLTAAAMEQLPRCERDLFRVTLASDLLVIPQPEVVYPQVTLDNLLSCMQILLQEAGRFEHHHIKQEPLSVRERMATILGYLQDHQSVSFAELFTPQEGRAGLVVSFLAILELVKQSLLQLIQANSFSPIYLMAADNVGH